MKREEIKCPYCGESYYMEAYSITTCVYYPPIYKNGVNINPDRNTKTTQCHCQNCGKNFSYQSICGEICSVEKVSDSE